MADRNTPGFLSSATEDDDARWRAHEAALRRQEAARAAAGISPQPSPPPIAAPPPPVSPAAAGVAPQPRRSRAMWIGGGVAALLAVAIAAPMLLRKSEPAPATSAVPGLKVTRRDTDSVRLSPQHPLPCYVNGVSVGSFTLPDCAARNGVASGRLDVGLDRSAADPVVVAARPPQVVDTPEDVPAPPTARLAQAPPPAAPRPRLFQSPPPTPVAPASRYAQVTPRFAPAPPVAYGRPSDRYEAQTAFAPVQARRPAPYSSPDDADQPSPEESAQAAGDFYTALGQANGERAASLVVPEKRHGGPLSAPAIDRFYSNLRAPLRITDLRPLNNHTVAVRYQFINPDGTICSGSSEVATTSRDGRVLVQGIRTHNRC